MPRCSKCGFMNAEEAVRCGKCGQKIVPGGLLNTPKKATKANIERAVRLIEQMYPEPYRFATIRGHSEAVAEVLIHNFRPNWDKVLFILKTYPSEPIMAYGPSETIWDIIAELGDYNSGIEVEGLRKETFHSEGDVCMAYSKEPEERRGDVVMAYSKEAVETRKERLDKIVNGMKEPAHRVVVRYIDEKIGYDRVLEEIARPHTEHDPVCRVTTSHYYTVSGSKRTIRNMTMDDAANVLAYILQVEKVLKGLEGFFGF